MHVLVVAFLSVCHLICPAFFWWWLFKSLFTLVPSDKAITPTAAVMQRKLQNRDQGDCCMPCIRKINETTKHFKTFTHAPAYLIVSFRFFFQGLSSSICKAGKKKPIREQLLDGGERKLVSFRLHKENPLRTHTFPPFITQLSSFSISFASPPPSSPRKLD
ncbi:hypothetical protein NC651_036731 [Populus alba x Populus x berolinensis]|nr:hypothetical protein NC651_036731 [Populus alba x Populus x berolinensis]